MAVLTWDQTGEHYYETGTDRGVIYPMTDDGDYGSSSSGTGVAWNGLTAVTEKASGGDATALYADNIKYLSLRAAEDFEATIEAYTYPEEFAVCDGSVEIGTGITIGQQERKTFGFCYRTRLGNDTDGDSYGYKLHLIYGATVSPTERAYETINDSPDAITFSWDVSTVPVSVDGYQPTACLTIDSTKIASSALTAIENALYGTSTTQPYLPLPDEILTLAA